MADPASVALVREGKAEPKRMNFTIQGLESLRPPTDRDRYYVFDLRTPGLAICVTARGAMTFYLYRRINGRPERLRLDAFPPMTIEQARKRAAAIQGEIALGGDPAADKRAFRAEWTMADLWADYLEKHAKVHKRTWKGDQYRYKKHLEGWAGRKLSAIRRTDVRELVNSIGGGEDGAPYEANRVLALIRALWNYAKECDWPGDNPAVGVQPFPETSRERYLTAAELPKFWKAIDDSPSQEFRDFARLAIFTGARKSNVLAMRWGDIDTVRHVWTIPAGASKNKQPMEVTLSPQAREVIDRRREDRGTSEFVFASWGKAGHRVEVKKDWTAFLTRAGLSDLRIHDLRRTLGSMMAAAGTPLNIIGKSLGHKSQSATAVYARINLDPIRAAVENAAAAIAAAQPKRKAVRRGKA